MAHSLTLTRSSATPTPLANRGDVFRLHVVASSTDTATPAEVFAHQRRLVNPDSGIAGDEFCFICSPFDLTIYPVDTPDAEQFPQFFRKSSIDILLPSQAAVEDAWSAIQAEVRNLMAAMTRGDTLQQGETVTIT